RLRWASVPHPGPGRRALRSGASDPATPPARPSAASGLRLLPYGTRGEPAATAAHERPGLPAHPGQYPPAADDRQPVRGLSQQRAAERWTRTASAELRPTTASGAAAA